MRFAVSVVCAGMALFACGCSSHKTSSLPPLPPVPPGLPKPNPVAVSDHVRETLPGDYLRISFVPANVTVTSIARPGALRGFATATPLYTPPMRLQELPAYSGLVNDDNNVLVAMRCRPPHPETVDALLATWPNVFAAIQRDIPGDPNCRGRLSDSAVQAECYARGFNDSKGSAVPTSLAKTFQYAAVLFDSDHKAVAKWLKDNYGIFPAFAGTGYSVKDSYNLDDQPMTSQQILVKSVSSEYILKNVSLSDAGCRCISVAPYPGRSGEPLDPEFIEQAGGDGVCTAVPELAPARR